MLVPNPAARLETFMFDNVPVDRIGLKVRGDSWWHTVARFTIKSNELKSLLIITDCVCCEWAHNLI